VVRVRQVAAYSQQREACSQQQSASSSLLSVCLDPLFPRRKHFGAHVPQFLLQNPMDQQRPASCMAQQDGHDGMMGNGHLSSQSSWEG
jgi:hypothetical protein